jgi:hypothetical protein
MIFCYVARVAEQTALAPGCYCRLCCVCHVRFTWAVSDGSSWRRAFGSTSLIGNVWLDVVFHQRSGPRVANGDRSVQCGVPDDTLDLWVGMLAGINVNATPATRR